MSPWREGAVRVSGGFLLLIGWFGAVNGWRLLATVLAAAAVHELGHCLVLRAAGARITGLRVGVFGAVLETDSARLSYPRELAALLAGPGANLLCAAALSLAGGGRWNVAVGANLVLCGFNLLPIRPLDGGRALYLLVSWAAGPAAGEWSVRWVGACAAASLATVLTWLMWRSGGSLWLLPAAAGLLAASLREALPPSPAPLGEFFKPTKR